MKRVSVHVELQWIKLRILVLRRMYFWKICPSGLKPSVARKVGLLIPRFNRLKNPCRPRPSGSRFSLDGLTRKMP